MLRLLSVLLLLTSCSSKVSFKAPISRLQMPEAIGESSRGEIKIFAQDDVEIVTANFIEDDPPRNLYPAIKDSELFEDGPNNTYFSGKSLGIMGTLGLSERFDLELRTTDDAPWVLSGRYQWLGESRINADRGNISLATTLGIGYGKETAQRNELRFKSSTLDTTRTYEGEVTTTQIDVAAIAGYRIFKNLLTYGGPFFMFYEADTFLDDVDRDLNYEFETEGLTFGANIGFKLDFGTDQITSIFLEYAHAKTKWERSKDTLTSIVFGVGGSY